MAGTTVTGSTNLTLLDSRIYASVCSGDIVVDTSPSVFIGSGSSNVLGVKVQITNPYNVVVRPYGGSYDINPPLTYNYTFEIPTQAGKLQYGIYKVDVELTDAGGTKYTVSKFVNVCTYTSDTYPCDDRVRLLADCKNGQLEFVLAEPPTFKGKFAESVQTSIKIDYPTASGQAPLITTYPNFTLQLFQGVYRATVDVCATYDMGDNIYLQLPYHVVVEKNVKCLLDYNCIYPAIKKLNAQVDKCLSQKDRIDATEKVLDALRLMMSAELANNAGEDASEYINDLEKLLGCQCTCDCTGSPIINNSPSTNVSIDGCLVQSFNVGLTKVYTIDAKNYFLTVQNNGILGISDVADYGCTIYQQLSFSVEAAYTAIKALVNSDNEYNFWASKINNVLNGVDASCLGYNSAQWAAKNFQQKFTALVQIACNGGAACAASISGVVVTQSGTNVILTFTQTGGHSADIYVDGILKGNVLVGTNTFTLVGYADGNNHDYLILAKCSNGSIGGTSAVGQFGFLACAFIAPPSLSQSTVNNAVCPFDLTSMVYPTPPLGITVEWHNANNTLPSSLVADDENVSSGVYYAFAKDAFGCYSTASVLTLVCNTGTSCTAPQSLLVEVAGGGFKVSFLSANNPPPSNSYTVKRKPAASPDVDGSYTTIGTPVYNGTSGRWEITDATGSNNALYTYKAQSNCSSSTPYVLYTFANLVCPVLTLTPSTTTINYSFPPVSGSEVNKYEVSLYNSTGAVLLETQTIVPTFANPVTGTFAYLTSETVYKVRLKIFIGTYSKTCDFYTTTTTGSTNYTLSSAYNFSIDSVSGTGVPSLPPTGLNTTLTGTHTGITGTIAIVISGSLVTTTKLDLTINGVPSQCQAVTGAGSYNFTGLSTTPSDTVRISINSGTC